MQTTITPEQISLFESTVRSVCYQLGLSDWEIRFETFTDPSQYAVQAEVRETYDGRVAVVRLNLENFTDTADSNIIAVAVHESLHILLCDEWHLCRELIEHLPKEEQAKYFSRLNSVQHATINRMIPLITCEYRNNK